MTSCLKKLCLKYSASNTFYCKIYSVLKILKKGSMNYKGVYRTAPATPGLLNIDGLPSKYALSANMVQCSAVQGGVLQRSAVQCIKMK